MQYSQNAHPDAAVFDELKTIPAEQTALDSAIYEAKNALQRHRDSGDVRPLADRRELAQQLGALVRATEAEQQAHRCEPADSYTETDRDERDAQLAVYAFETRPQRGGKTTELSRDPYDLDPLEIEARPRRNGKATEQRIDRARTVLVQEGFPESRSSFDGPGDVARLSAALRDMIALLQGS